MCGWKGVRGAEGRSKTELGAGEGERGRFGGKEV